MTFSGDLEKSVMRRMLAIDKEKEYLKKVLDYIQSGEDIDYEEVSKKYGDHWQK